MEFNLPCGLAQLVLPACHLRRSANLARDKRFRRIIRSELDEFHISGRGTQGCSCSRRQWAPQAIRKLAHVDWPAWSLVGVLLSLCFGACIIKAASYQAVISQLCHIVKAP